MYVYYDSDGNILCAVQASSSHIEPPNNAGTPLYLDDEEYANVYNDLSNYIIQSGTPVYSPKPITPPEPQPPTEVEVLQKETTSLRYSDDLISSDLTNLIEMLIEKGVI